MLCNLAEVGTSAGARKAWLKRRRGKGAGLAKHLRRAGVVFRSLLKSKLPFTVLFRKRSDGTRRKMVAVLDRVKKVKGSGMAYNPKKYNLQVAYDLQAGAYRCIPLEGILSIQIGKDRIKF